MEYVHLKESNDEILVFEVSSSSRNSSHDVYFHKNNGWVCTCEQYYFRKKPCKHMKKAYEHYRGFYEKMDLDFVFHEKGIG